MEIISHLVGFVPGHLLEGETRGAFVANAIKDSVKVSTALLPKAPVSA